MRKWNRAECLVLEAGEEHQSGDQEGDSKCKEASSARTRVGRRTFRKEGSSRQRSQGSLARVSKGGSAGRRVRWTFRHNSKKVYLFYFRKI